MNVKALSILAVCLLATTVGWAQFPSKIAPGGTPMPGTELTAEELHNAPTIEIWKLDEKPLDYNDKIVRVHVEGRLADIKNNDKGGISGRVGAQLNGEWFYLDAQVPEAGATWFRKLPVHTVRPPQYMYARITYDGKTHTAHFLGREARFGLGAPVLLW